MTRGRARFISAPSLIFEQQSLLMRSDLVTVDRFANEHFPALGLKLVAGKTGLKRAIREPTVNRPVELRWNAHFRKLARASRGLELV